MPTIINTSGIKAGCIYRIKLVNFVTYKDVELYPGLSLNMIIGPNGTGKSTFVSALILGLCGNIASIGRAKKISEYIRSECEEAIIEIELYQERGKPNVKITRVFNQREVSKWYIDNKLVAQKNVKDLISSFNIQVDNLCQLLPQDRVKDFAKMTPPTLLQSTLSAIGEQKRVDQLEQLKQWRSDQCSLINKIQKNEKKRQDLINENDLLQKRIDIINRRKEINNEIKVCNSKKLWIEEAIFRIDCQQYDQDKKGAEKLVKTNRKKIQPLENSLKKVHDEIKQLEKEKRTLNAKINEFMDQTNDSLRSVKIQNDNIKEAHSWYLEIEKSQAIEAKELEIAKVKLDRLQVDLAQAMNKYGDETRMRLQLTSLRKTMSELESKKYKSNEHRQKIQYDFERTLFPEMARCRSKISALEDVDRKRLQTLEGYSADAYKALVWLRANKTLFSGPVCEPMMLEIRFSDRRFSRYLESTVSRRDLVAFTFLKTEDMNLFLTKVRQELGLRQVNAVCSPPVREPFKSPDIRAISNYGFKTYVVDTFMADEMIVRYLCKNYNVHRIPIGDDFTYNNSGQVPDNITTFFSENHRFSVKVSRYSGDRSTSITEIPEPFLLADTLDVDKINEWKNQLTELEQKKQTYAIKKRNLDTELGMLDSEYNTLVTNQTAIQEHSSLIRQLSFKIRAQEATVQEKSQPSLNLQEEKEKCAKTQKECVMKQMNLHRDLVGILARVHTYTLQAELISMALRKKRNSIVDQDKQLHELTRKLAETEERLQSILQMEEHAKQKASAKLKEALRSSNNKRPEDPQFPSQDIYKRLPDELSQLQDHCNDLTTKMDRMSHSDEGDLQTYERNKKLIEQLSLEEVTIKNDHKKLESSMVKIRAEWMKFVNRLIVDISVRFRDMFAKLNFGGEVRLDKGTCEDEFGLYGVVIMVKFQPGEPLRVLTPFEQSGGERAISTAVYLLALQHLTKVPFRCVDEINQGMDSKNEKKMFEFLVKVTTEGEQGQYFLLTPKLLTGLQYNENVAVQTIMNGRGALTYDQWQLDTFIANMGSCGRPS